MSARLVHNISILILILRKNYTIQVAADKVTEDNTTIYAEDFPYMYLPERQWNAAVVECICNAVGESTHDEERNCKQQWKIMFLTGKTD